MIGILNSRRNKIENKITAENSKNIIRNNKVIYDFQNKTETIQIDFREDRSIEKDSFIVIKDENRNDSEFICVNKENNTSYFIPSYAYDLSKVFKNTENNENDIKEFIINLLSETDYNVEFENINDDIKRFDFDDDKTVFEKLINIALENNFSIRHKFDINSNRRTLIIKKGLTFRKNEPKVIENNLKNFEFNINKSNIKTAVIVYNINNKKSITVRNEENQSRFFNDNKYTFGFLKTEESNDENLKNLALDYLNTSVLNNIEMNIDGRLLRNWMNLKSNDFVSNEIYIDYKVVKPALLNKFTISKFERNIFDYNPDNFKYTLEYLNGSIKGIYLNNYLNGGKNNILLNDINELDNEELLDLLKQIFNKKIDYFKDYIDNLNPFNNENNQNFNLNSSKELNFDAIISDFNIIRSQKDQVLNQLKSIFDSAYLKEDSIKIQVRDKIKDIESEFDNIQNEVNKLNRDNQDTVLMKNVNSIFIDFYVNLRSIKNIIEISNEAINIEMNKLQNEYSHGIKDTIFEEISRVLGMEYDRENKRLKGSLEVLNQVTGIKNSLDLLRQKVFNIENSLLKSNKILENNLLGFKNNIANILGLPLNADGFLDGEIDNNEEIIEAIKDRIAQIKDEVDKSKENLEETKNRLNEQQTELEERKKEIDSAIAESSRVREDLDIKLEESQQEFDYYKSSRGDNLIYNGNAEQGTNINFNEMRYDNSDSYQSSGSFLMTEMNNVFHSDRLIPINTEKTYKLSMFVKNNTNLPSSIGHLSYDRDGYLIESHHVMGSEMPVLELARPLQKGDTKIYLKSVKGLDDSYRFKANPPEYYSDKPNLDYDQGGLEEIPMPGSDINTGDLYNYSTDEVDIAQDSEEKQTYANEEDYLNRDNGLNISDEELIDLSEQNGNSDSEGETIINRNSNPDLKNYNNNHSLVIWNYLSEDGYDYGVSTYSRYTFMNGWDYNAIDYENNAVKLNRPFDLVNNNSTDGVFPEGTKLSATFTDEKVQWSIMKHEDIPNENENDDPEEFNGWYHRQGIITKENVRGTNGFLYGTYFIKLYFSVNEYDNHKDYYDINFEDGSDTAKFWITNLEMYDVTGLESVRKIVIDTNELVATMMTKKEMDDYRNQVLENFSNLSQTVDKISAEVSKKIQDLDDKYLEEISSKVDVMSGKIDAVSSRQITDKDELIKQLGEIKIETDNINQRVQEITTESDNKFRDISTDINQVKENITLTAQNVERIKNDNEDSLKELRGQLIVANDKISQEVTARESAIQDTMQTLKGEISTSAEQIKLDVSKDYATKSSLNDSVTSLNSSINLKVGEIDQFVKSESYKKDIRENVMDNLKIGNDNLLIGTEKFELPFLQSIPKITKDNVLYANAKSSYQLYQIVKVKPNTDYVLSYNAYSNNSTGADIVQTPITKASDINTEINPTSYLVIPKDSYRYANNEEKRFKLNFNSKNANFIKIKFISVNDVYVNKLKLEEGNVPTNWTPSSKDYESRFVKNETRIRQNEESINLSSQKLTEYEGRTTKLESNLTVANDSIRTLVRNQTEMDGKINANTSSISQFDNKITTQVSSVKNELNDKVDNISIGGRNLLLGTLNYDYGFENKLDNRLEKIGDKLWVTVYNDWTIQQVISTIPNENYTISFKVRPITDNTTSSVYIPIKEIDEKNNEKYISYKSFDFNKEEILSFKINVTTKKIRISFLVLNSSYPNFYITDMKVEKGNKATDWTPAPEDYDDKFENIEKTLSSYKTSIEQTDRKIDLTAQQTQTDLLNTLNGSIQSLSNGLLNELEDISVGNVNLLLNSEYRDSFLNNSTHSYTKYELTKPLKVGKTYTFACDFISNDERQSGKTSVYPYNPAGDRKDLEIQDGKVKYTFEATSESKNLLVYKDVAGQSNSDLNVHIENAILVEGNKIGNYQKAPQEIQENIDKVINNLDQTVKNNYANLKVETDKISSIVQEQALMKGEISENTSKINQLPDKISSQVSSMEVKLNKSISDVSNNINNVENKVDNIYMGGKNLLQSFRPELEGLVDPMVKNTEKFFSDQLWATPIYKPDYIRKYLEPNTEYTFTYEMTITEANVDQVDGKAIGFLLYDYTTRGTHSNLGYKSLPSDINKFNEKYLNKTFRESRTFTTPSNFDNNYNILGYFGYGIKNGQREYIKGYISYLKLEKGNKSSGWSPAPEDIASSINSIEVNTRNYLPNYRYSKNSIYYFGGTNIDPDNKYKIYFSSNAAYLGISFENYKLEKGQTYTFQIHETDDPHLKITMQDAYRRPLRNLNDVDITNMITDGAITFTTPKDTFFVIRIETSTAFSYLGKIGLYKGIRKTDWSPAPEDFEDSINVVSETLNSKIDQSSGYIKAEVDQIRQMRDGTFSRNMSSFLIDPTNINAISRNVTIQADRISLGNESNLVIENNSVKVKELQFDRLYGGTAKLGGVFDTDLDGKKVVGGKSYPNGSIEVRDKDSQPKVIINSEGTSLFDRLRVGELVVDDISTDFTNFVKSTQEKIEYHVIGSSGSDTNSGNSKEDGLQTIQEAIDRLPKYLRERNNVKVFIYDAYDLAEGLITIEGFNGSGNLTIQLVEFASIFARFNFRNNTAKIVLTGGELDPEDDEGVSTTAMQNYEINEPDDSMSYVIRNDGTQYMEIYNLTINCYVDRTRNKQPRAIDTRNNSGLRVAYTQVNNAYYAVYASYLSRTYSGGNCRGITDGPAYYALSGAIIHLTKGYAFGSNSVNVQSKYGSRIFEGENDLPPEADGGKNAAYKPSYDQPKVVAPKTKTVTKAYTNTYTAVNSGHWAGSNVKSSWNSSYVMSGSWYGSPVETGAWIFPSSLKSDLKGKNITNISIKVTRMNNVGWWNKSISSYIVSHNTYSLGSSPPSFSSNNYKISMDAGQTKTFNITSAFKTGLKNGTIAGFGLKAPASDAYYLALSSKCTVTVTYTKTITIKV